MKTFAVPLLLAFATRALASEPMSLGDAVRHPGLHCALTSNASDQITFTVLNRGQQPVTIGVPAGALCGGAEGTAQLAILSAARVEVAAGATVETQFPAAMLTSKLPPPVGSIRLLATREPRLDSLLKRLAGEKDLPRSTAQLAAFCLLEDLTFAQWQQFLTARRSSPATQPPAPTPAEIVQAIDVLGLLREIAPDRPFALAKDGELKLRALRNPWCRAKAMQLYGLTLTGAASEADLPNLSQLLHTKPGDNCPICRNRAEMQKGAGDF